MQKFSITGSSLLTRTVATSLFATSMDSTIATYQSSYSITGTRIQTNKAEEVSYFLFTKSINRVDEALISGQFLYKSFEVFN